jgi:hypothetical protein
LNIKKRHDRSRSPLPCHDSYGITSESFKKKHRSVVSRYVQQPTASNGFIPDEETKKFYEKSTSSETGFWTSEDYTFRDMLAKDVRDEIEDDIASRNSDEQSDVDSELAEYADRADMDDDDNEEQKKTIVERLIPMKNIDEKIIHDSKLNKSLINCKRS